MGLAGKQAKKRPPFLSKIMQKPSVETALQLYNGWTRPRRREIVEYTKLIERKISRVTSGEMVATLESTLRLNGLGAMGEWFKQTQDTQNTVRLIATTRVATKFALDAIGVKGSVRRNKVQELMGVTAYNFLKADSKINFAAGNRALAGVFKELGPYRGCVFFNKYVWVVQKMRAEQEKSLC